jgi:signal transduction histidine kinase
MERAGDEIARRQGGAASAQVRNGSASLPLRFRLFLLAASGLVPLALVLLLAAAYLAQERQTEAQHSAMELSRALATAVDAELRFTITLLDNLAIAAELQRLEPRQLGENFVPLAKRVMESQQWRAILVADARGEILMRVGEGAGQAARGAVEPQSLAQVLSTRAPAIGRVARGPLGREAFAVRVPVTKVGELRYVLSAVVPTSQIHAVIARQQLVPTWVVGVFDQDGNRVARSKENIATRYSPSLEALVKAKGREGTGITRTVEGVESHTGFSRLRTSQWVVAVGIPTAEANADLYRLLLAVGAGTAASLGLLAFLAWRMARSISGPIDELKQAAWALGRGRQVELASLGVEELDEVGLALRQAAIDRDQANARRSKAEEERELLLARLEEALRLAEQANRNKDEFLALLGHELRNPLAPIMNAVHLMGLKGDDRTLPERRIIQRQLNYVKRLVDDLLDASRITSNRFVMNLRPLRPIPVLEQTIEALRPNFGARTLKLNVAPQARQVWVLADEARLVQVFNNLLGNAIKFTSPDGTIEVEAGLSGAAVEFVIRDDGVGMSAADLQRAFDLFYQAPNESRGVSGGLGLGLAIVKSLIEMQSGSVDVASAGPGAGTTVTVKLPLTEPVREEPSVSRAPVGAPSTKVLVVDDNEDAADTLSTLLEASNFVVRVAYAPQPALDAVESFQPEVVVLDIGLPGMDGYEVARRLRAATPPFQGKLVALTGYGQQQDVDKAMSAGFDAHLTKPVEPDELVHLIARLTAP